MTGGVFLFVCAVWLNWYGTFRRLAIDERGIEVVSCSSPRRDPTESDIDTVPKSWAWGGPDRVEFKDVDDWAILPVRSRRPVVWRRLHAIDAHRFEAVRTDLTEMLRAGGARGDADGAAR